MKKQRNLDSNYFRIKNNNKWESICFSDLNEEDMTELLRDKDAVFVKRLCVDLGKTIRKIGDIYNIECLK